MEIKATLKKPYNYKERANFVSKWINYEIKETKTELQAWGRTAEEQTEFELENKKSSIRAIRDSMINSMSWMVERANEQRELGLPSVDDYGMLLEYRQYLRDYPEKVEKWWEQNPKTFEEWKNV
jgi:phosphoribulokinase